MISSDEAESPAWISDSDAETIWMSRIAMNIPNTMKMNAATRLIEKLRAPKPARARGAQVRHARPWGARIASASLTA